jgi:hypothetical protein
MWLMAVLIPTHLQCRNKPSWKSACRVALQRFGNNFHPGNDSSRVRHLENVWLTIDQDESHDVSPACPDRGKRQSRLFAARHQRPATKFLRRHF